MKTIICGAVAALATLTFAMTAEAAPGANPSAGTVSTQVRQAAQDLEQVHWRPYRHCHTRRVVTNRWGRRNVRIVRTCHGGRGRRW